MTVGPATLADVAAIVRLEGVCQGVDAWSEALVRDGVTGGVPTVHHRVVRATVGSGWRAPAGKRQYARVRLDQAGPGLVCSPVGGQGSHLVADLASADALAVVPEEMTDVAEGTQLDCLLLDRVRS